MNTQQNIDILDGLSSFVNQRPGFDWHNYDSMSQYRSDYNPVLQAKHDFHTMRRFSELYSVDIMAGQSAFSGRLEIKPGPDRRVEIDYCTGQYFPVEYRNAACAVLASAIWSYWRDCGYDTGDKLRKKAHQEFGRGLANRWFN